MKKYITIAIIILIIIFRESLIRTFFVYNPWIGNDTKLAYKVDIILSDNSVTLDYFPNWTIGYIGINELSLSENFFQQLDSRLFDKLIDSHIQGNCEIEVCYRTKDSYGNPSKNCEKLGKININELKKYDNVKYWRSEIGGIKKLFSITYKIPH